MYTHVYTHIHTLNTYMCMYVAGLQILLEGAEHHLALRGLEAVDDAGDGSHHRRLG